MRNFVLIALLAALCLSQDASDPWTKTEEMQTAALAAILKEPNPPTVLCVAFPVLYDLKHITHSSFVGPGSKPEGIEKLKKLVADLPRSADIVIYCGCCPMVKCPNIRPSYKALKEMGFTHIRVLDVPTNMSADWYSKNYPTEVGKAAEK
jgi:hypothetical protein